VIKLQINKFGVFLAVFLNLSLAQSSISQEQATPINYPNSSIIEPRPLTQTQREVLEKLFEPNISADLLAKRSSELCSRPLLKSAAVDEFTKKNVTKAESSLVTEVLFELDGQKSGIEIERFSIQVEFEKSRVVARHLSPRFQGDAGGFRVPMASNVTRAVRLEGKLGADLVAFVPPLSDCAFRAVALCPRRYTKNDELLRAPYSAKGVRPIFSLKADGVFAPPAQAVGRVTTSLLASAGLTLPSEWFLTATGSGTVSKEIEFSVPRDERKSSQAVLPLKSEPLNFSIESRVDLGHPDSAVRRTSERIDSEVSTVKVADFYDIELGTSEMSVEGGTCALIVEAWEESL
jgi:hypothetical protein